MIVNPRFFRFIKPLALAAALATAYSVHATETKEGSAIQDPGCSISRSTCGFQA